MQKMQFQGLLGFEPAATIWISSQSPLGYQPRTQGGVAGSRGKTLGTRLLGYRRLTETYVTFAILLSVILCFTCDCVTGHEHIFSFST